MLFALVVFILILLFFLFEAYQHKKNLDAVPIRILVNGTRGKSTIVRLLVSSLNDAGIRTLGRSTGSEAQLLLPDGTYEPIIRKRDARIYELIGFFKRAKKENVKCVVVECMALQSENQVAVRDKLVKPTDVIICNTYVDHIPEMGTDVETTAKVLALSVPKEANLYVTEKLYDDISSNVIHINLDNIGESVNGIHPASIAICSAFLESKKLDTSHLDKAISSFIPDKGLLPEMKVGNGSLFIPTFSVNDLSMMEETILKYEKRDGKKLNIIYNNRGDREYRILLFKDILTRQKNGIDTVYVIGDYKQKVERIYSKFVSAKAVELESLKAEIKRSENSIFIGLGNIKGDGEKLLDLLSR